MVRQVNGISERRGGFRGRGSFRGAGPGFRGRGRGGAMFAGRGGIQKPPPLMARPMPPPPNMRRPIFHPHHAPHGPIGPPPPPPHRMPMSMGMEDFGRMPIGQRPLGPRPGPGPGPGNLRGFHGPRMRGLGPRGPSRGRGLRLPPPGPPPRGGMMHRGRGLLPPPMPLGPLGPGPGIFRSRPPIMMPLGPGPGMMRPPGPGPMRGRGRAIRGGPRFRGNTGPGRGGGGGGGVPVGNLPGVRKIGKPGRGRGLKGKGASSPSGELNKPWVTEAMKNEILKKHKLHQKAKKARTKEDWETFKEHRNKVTTMLREAKLEYIGAHPEEDVDKILAEAANKVSDNDESKEATATSEGIETAPKLEEGAEPMEEGGGPYEGEDITPKSETEPLQDPEVEMKPEPINETELEPNCS